MSIIERALQKLHSGTPAAPGAHTARGAQVEITGDSPSRKIIGEPAKTLKIDLEGLRRSGFLPPEHQQRELAHQFRTIKRPLIRNAIEAAAGGSRDLPRTVMVTSALPGEGKTFTSLNLALSLALEKDHGLVLVDGDVAKPQLSNVLGVAGEPGLLDLLVDPKLSLNSVVRPTSVRGLSMLPVGRRTDTATELLASARMRQILSQLEQLDPHGMVLVDSPPLLVTSEARVLASLFAQVVIVISAGTTPRAAVTEAINIVGPGPRLGLVLNQASHDLLTGGYYGYANYGAGDAVPGTPESGRASLSAVRSEDP
jgi:exopolysaccharide/PEP-CTERM locus tyrosine autokinase